MSAIELLDDVTELQEMPREASEMQLLEWHLKSLDFKEATIKGLEQRIEELQTMKAVLEQKVDLERNTIEAGMSILGLDKLKVIGVGTASWTNRKASVSVESDDAAIGWAEKYAPDLVKTVKKLDKTAFKQLAMQRMVEDGELVPGAAYEPERRVLTIRRAK